MQQARGIPREARTPPIGFDAPEGPSRPLKNPFARGPTRDSLFLAEAKGAGMRGSDRRSGELFSYVSIEARIRADHPLRTIRRS